MHPHHPPKQHLRGNCSIVGGLLLTRVCFFVGPPPPPVRGLFHGGGLGPAAASGAAGGAAAGTEGLASPTAPPYWEMGGPQIVGGHTWVAKPGPPQPQRCISPGQDCPRRRSVVLRFSLQGLKVYGTDGEVGVLGRGVVMGAGWGVLGAALGGLHLSEHCFSLGNMLRLCK